MILTPISREQLRPALDRFAAGLSDSLACRLFDEIRATSPDRALGEEAERHRLAAIDLARACGVPVHPPGTTCRFNWDGVALDGGTEAYVILHEIAHYLLAPAERRGLIDFGLGPGPDTTDREAAAEVAMLPVLEREVDEAMASLAGILSEARLGQPALASFLDQNWLEGLDRGAAPRHFTLVAADLRNRGLLALDPNRAICEPALSPSPR
jgi:hypothetical protein